jgi:hypothetical protein
MYKSTSKWACWWRVSLATIFICAANARDARASISFVDMFRSDVMTQTGNGNSLTTNGYFLSSDLFSTNANDYNAVQMSYPGPSSVSLTQTSPTVFTYQTGLLASQAALDTAFPTGAYTYNASGAAGPASTTINYLLNDYARSTPYLTGTDYSQLQGVNAGLPFNVHFSPFVTGGQASSSFIFFTIFDTTSNTQVLNDSFLAATTTGITIPVGTLTAGQNYTYELIFSNRDTVPSPDAEFDAQIGFDLRTSGAFTAAAGAAVPEPSAIIVWSLLGCFGIAIARARTKMVA